MGGYDIFRKDRVGGVKGGGVLLYTRVELGALLYKTRHEEGEHSLHVYVVVFRKATIEKILSLA
jgi:hypothetical protein